MALTEVEPKARSARRQITALLGLALLLGALLAGGIAWQHGVFQRRAEVYFIADDVTALTPGTTVRLSGFRIGKISALELQPNLKVKVTMTIEAEPFSHLKADAHADVVREQLKPAAIELHAGVADKPLPADDPRVGYARRGTLTEIAEDLRKRLAPILEDVKQLTGTARERKADIDAVLQNAHAITAELAGTAREVHALSAELRQRAGSVGKQSEALLGEANKSVVKLGSLLGQAEQSLDAINTKLPGLMRKADDTLTNLEAVMRDGRTVSAAAAAGLPGMLRSAPPLIEDSREMVQGLRQTWPMRSLLPPAPPAMLPIDSHDSTALREPALR